jgi:hypothetical protein
MAKTTLTIDITYDPEVTHPEGLASAMDRLLETALSIPQVMDEYGPPKFGEFFVAGARKDRPEPEDELDARRRWVLYDLGGDQLLTTRAYASYAEAVEDANQAEDVLVLPLVCRNVMAETTCPDTPMQGLQTYRLRIDGPLLREQQKVLIGILAGQKHTQETRRTLEGILELLDEVADQAHDRHGIDCLLCECEEPGCFYSGVPGILARVENGKLVPGTKVERCDLCQRYSSDEAALEKLRELGYVQP